MISHSKSTLEMSLIVDGVISEVVFVEAIMCFLLISLYKSFLFLGLRDDDEALLYCLMCLIFRANSNNFGAFSLLTIFFNIGESSLDSSRMKLEPSVKANVVEEDDESLIVEYLCI